ncbi:hypothetical protein BvCmsKKNP005_04630 [Escherichia coli]|nr:hypothetical protein BvCmsKKNP005_04630 [Escherichia coli]
MKICAAHFMLLLMYLIPMYGSFLLCNIILASTHVKNLQR